MSLYSLSSPWRTSWIYTQYCGRLCIAFSLISCVFHHQKGNRLEFVGKTTRWFAAQNACGFLLYALEISFWSLSANNLTLLWSVNKEKLEVVAKSTKLKNHISGNIYCWNGTCKWRPVFYSILFHSIPRTVLHKKAAFRNVDDEIKLHL